MTSPTEAPSPRAARSRALRRGASLVAAVALALCGAAGAGAQEIPAYELDLRLELDPGRMTGRARIVLPRAVREEGTARFSVARPGGTVMAIESVQDAAGAALPFHVSDGTLAVEVGSAPGGRTVVVDYAFPVDRSQLQPFGYYVFGPFGPGLWAYPTVVAPDAGTAGYFADYRVRFDHPASLTVLTTGGAGEAAPQGDRVTARYEAEHTQGFAIVAGEGFTVTRATVGDVPVVAFHHPDNAERFQRVIRNAGEAAAWYRETYGFFPLEEVRIFQGHPRWGGGYPLPNLFAVHLGILDDDFLRYITAHELGHYYWGLHVLGQGGALDWLQLALGIWADQRYLAHVHGRTLTEQLRRGVGEGDWLADYLEAVVRNREQRLGLSAAEQAAQTFDYNSLVRHGKAATGIYLQSLLLGEERFLTLQKEILASYRHRPLPPESFVALLEEAGLEGAGAFFERWVEGDATVGVAVEAVEPDQGGGWSVALSRTGTVPYPVEVEVRPSDVGGRAVTHTVAADAARDTVRVPFRPGRVLVDPEGRIPMWDSSHPEIRAVWARALERGGLYEPFLEVGRSVLASGADDPYLRYRVVRRLFLMGRWEESARQAPAGPGCADRNACMAALYGARSLARLGRASEAEARVRAVEEDARGHGLASLVERARSEGGG